MAKKEQNAEDIVIIKDDMYKRLELLAKEKGKSVREMAMNENAEEFELVLDLFYNEIKPPKKWFISRGAFRAMFLKTREFVLATAGF